MEREALLLILGSALFGLVVWLAAVLASKMTAHCAETERSAWWCLVSPVLIGLMVVSFLIGWALQEPDPADEWARSITFVVAGAMLVIAGRSLLRAWLTAHRRGYDELAIGTVGLLRSQVVISPDFAGSARPEVLAAALAHEAAHMHARDPLRIWLAQLLADLQWPIAGTQERLQRWLVSLELRRDDEALATGADPSALAEAILLAARQTAPTAAVQGAQVMGDGAGISHRVRRLLSRDIQPPPGHTTTFRFGIWLACSASFALPLWLGFAYGEAILTVLPGIGR